MASLLNSAATFAEHLSLTLMHSLWIVGLIAVVALITVRLLRNRSAAMHHGIWVWSLVLGVCSLPVTFVAVHNAVPEQTELSTRTEDSETAETIRPLPLFDSRDQTHSANGRSMEAGGSARVIPGTAQGTREKNPSERVSSVSEIPQVTLRWIAPIYLLVVASLLCRILVAAAGGRRLRDRSCVVARPDFLRMLERQSQLIGLRVAPLVLVCESVAVPVVVGILRPAILIPSAMLTGLTFEQLTAVVTHELAHIRRFDPWIVAVQRVAECVLFFNPAVWFISRNLNVERERCCDDLVLETGTSALNYAESLLRIAELQIESAGHADALAVAANGGNPSDLRLRIARLLGDSDSRRFRFSVSAGTGLLAIFLAAGTTLLASAIPDAAGNSDEATTTATGDAPETTREFIDPISGVVRGPDGQPIPNVAILVMRDGTGYTGPDARPNPPELITKATTDAQGRFVVDDVPDSDRLERWGRGPFPLLFVAQAEGMAIRWESLLAHPGKDLTIRLRPSGRLTGRVQTASGTPVADAVIRVAAFLPLTELTSLDQKQLTPRFMWGSSLNLQNSAIDVSTRTDAQGRFLLVGIPGNHGLELAVDDPRFLRRKFYACANAKHPRVLEATNGTILTSPVELSVSPASHVRVRVVDDKTGDPLPLARVAGSPTFNVLDAETSRDATFEFHQQKPGDTLVAYVYPPVGSDYLGRVERVDLPQEAGTEEVTVRLEHGVVATGTVRSASDDRPVEDAWIVWGPGDGADPTRHNEYNYGLRISRFGPYIVPQAESDSDGRFRLIVPPDAGHLRFARRPRGYRRAGQAAATCRPESGEDTVTFDLRLKPTQRMFGTVSLPDGSPAPNVTISTAANIRRDGGVSYYPIRRDGYDDGTYDIPDLYCDGSGEKPGTPCDVIVFRTRDRKFAALVTTPLPPNFTDDVEFPVLLEPTATLTGRLVDSVDGRPIPDISIMLYRRDLKYGPETIGYEADHDGGQGSVYTDEDGRFTITGLIPGIEQHPSIRARGYTRPGSSSSINVVPEPGEVIDLGDLKLKPINPD